MILTLNLRNPNAPELLPLPTFLILRYLILTFICVRNPNNSRIKLLSQRRVIISIGRWLHLCRFLIRRAHHNLFPGFPITHSSIPAHSLKEYIIFTRVQNHHCLARCPTSLHIHLTPFHFPHATSINQYHRVQWLNMDLTRLSHSLTTIQTS